MVNRRANSDADISTSLPSVAPVVKRKRRASCLGEQERRERKRAIDREAQRSLREKTKTHIAELERTIEILRNQDRNGATASLLTEIEGLRAENERLRDVIDGVRSVIGGDVFGRMAPAASNATTATAGRQRQDEVAMGSPTLDAAGPVSPRLRRASTSYSQATTDAKPPLSSPSPESQTDAHYGANPFDFTPAMPSTSRTVDLDGMTVMPISLPPSTTHATTSLDLALALDPVAPVSVSTQDTCLQNLPTPDSPTTAAFAPFMSEIFGDNWRCPSPLVLHIDNPPPPASPSPSQTCPIWRRSNELFGKIFSCRPPAPGMSSFDGDWGAEAGLLFQGIRDGWESFDEWKQSPVLRILKAVDQFLFVKKNGRMERLAASYKSFKLLKYYLTPTKSDLSKVPAWLRPTTLQSSTSHPIAIDMFAWPALRNRLVHQHSSLFRDSKLSIAYAAHLRFDWPFSFEDTFYFDDVVRGWYPSPLFERYHGDQRSWTVGEGFWEGEGLEELRGDIMGVVV